MVGTIEVRQDIEFEGRGFVLLLVNMGGTPETVRRAMKARGYTAPVVLVIKNLAALAVNPRRTAEMYAISNDGAIFKTTDGGRTWGN